MEIAREVHEDISHEESYDSSYLNNKCLNFLRFQVTKGYECISALEEDSC